MSPGGFLIVAGLMTAAACALLVWPLVRSGQEKAPLAAGGVIALVPLLAAAMYLGFSNWPWQQPPAVAAAPVDQDAASIEQMVGRLEQRLQTQPDDAEGWQMLGRSYVVLGRYREAVLAYDRARKLSGDTDIVALTGYAEALAMQNDGVIGPESAALFDRALTLDPDDRKALWYGGLAAIESGQPALAIDRWQRLLGLNPPEAMARVLREQIAMVAGASEPGSAVVRPDVTPAASLRVDVALNAALADRAPHDATVFILARPVNGDGPPLAVVRRRVADLPLQLTLSDADAMIPGRTISSQAEVEVVARIALGGAPTAQPGDLYGSRVAQPDGVVAISIDRVF